MSNFLFSRKGFLTLFGLFLIDVTIQVVINFARNLMIGGPAVWHGAHIVLGLLMVIFAVAAKNHGEIFTSTSPYTNDFWSNTIAPSAILGVVLSGILLRGSEFSWVIQGIVGMVVGVYAFLPMMLTARAMIIVAHDN